MKTLSIFFLLFFGFILSADAATFTVNLITDLHDASASDGICDANLTTAGEQCSLRAAIEQANSLNTSDRILFNLPAKSIITLTTANGGEIPVANNGALEIIGTDANNLTINGGTGTNRIFYTNEASAFISGVTMTGGDGTGAAYSGDGGAVFVLNGSVTFDRVHITGNTAIEGGGVYFYNGGNHRITNSTVSGNTANLCGGFGQFNGPALTLINSTVSGNKATTGVGGFCNQNSMTTLRETTVTNNSAPYAGGFTINGVLFFGNTIVAGNTAIRDARPEIEFDGGTIVSEGNNFIGDSPGDSSNTLNHVDYRLSDVLNQPPLLGALQNNGGTTPTHALLAGSPAINRGSNSLAFDPINNAAIVSDQRGSPRIVGNTIDIGAFESDTPAPPPTPTPTPTPTCSYIVNPIAQDFPSAGGSGSISVTTASDCAYTAQVASDSSFITITNGAAGRGNGTISFTVAANSGAARTGTILVAGETVTINQAVFRRKKMLLSPFAMSINLGSTLFYNVFAREI